MFAGGFSTKFKNIFMEKLIHFFSFTDPNIRIVVIGCVLLCSSSAAVGCFAFLRKQSLAGDAVAHSVLPGVCLSFILAGTKNIFILITGAFLTGWLSLWVTDYLSTRTRIKSDTATGLVLSTFFAFGILLLTGIQHSGNASQSGLDSFLFGKAAAMIGQDVIVFSVVSAFVILSVILFFRQFTLVSFDRQYASTIGLNVRVFELMLTTLTVLSVVAGIQAVGVVLMAAMLITPAAAARFWTHNIKTMIVLASLFGIFAGIAGALISYLAPAMPTGPWIVMVISLIAILSFIFAPGRGIIAKYWKQRLNQIHILEENILKLLYQLSEKEKDFQIERTILEIRAKRDLQEKDLLYGLKRLKKQGWVIKTNKGWSLTQEGIEKGKRVTRLHRLWEMYLTNYLQLAPDHVHDDAETMEHIITPELEKRLEELLHFPKVDPHQSEIPR